MRVGALDQEFVCLVHSNDCDFVVVLLDNFEEIEIWELGSLVTDVDQGLDVPCLGVNHVNSVGVPDEND